MFGTKGIDNFTGKEIIIPEGTEINLCTTFVSGNIKYIILSIRQGNIEVIPFDEYVKRITFQKCGDDEYRTLKEIEELK